MSKFRLDSKLNEVVNDLSFINFYDTDPDPRAHINLGNLFIGRRCAAGIGWY